MSSKLRSIKIQSDQDVQRSVVQDELQQLVQMFYKSFRSKLSLSAGLEERDGAFLFFFLNRRMC